MRICCACHVAKPLTGFYKKGASGVHSKCKPCYNRYCMERWEARKRAEIERRGNKCADCLQSFHICAYDFHHLDPSVKEFSWGKSRQISEGAMQRELAKCVLLCSNCHRLRHYRESRPLTSP